MLKAVDDISNGGFDEDQITPEVEVEDVSVADVKQEQSMAVFRHEWDNGASIECTCPESEVETLTPNVMFKLEFEKFGDKILTPLVEAFGEFMKSKSVMYISKDGLNGYDLITFVYSDPYLKNYSLRYTYPKPNTQFKFIKYYGNSKELVETNKTNLVQGVMDMYVEFIDDWVKTHSPLY